MFDDHGANRGFVLHPERGTRPHQEEVAPDTPELEGTPELQALGELAFVKAIYRLGSSALKRGEVRL